MSLACHPFPVDSLILQKATTYRQRIQQLTQERDQMRTVLLHQEHEIRRMKAKLF